MVIVVDSNGNLSISVRPYTILQAKRWNILNQDHGFAIGPIRFWPDDMSILAMQDNFSRLKVTFYTPKNTYFAKISVNFKYFSNIFRPKFSKFQGLKTDRIKNIITYLVVIQIEFLY